MRAVRMRARAIEVVMIANTHVAAFAIALLWTCGAQAQELATRPATDYDSRDLTAVDDAVDFLPSAHEADPWVSLGAGWRGYWIEHDEDATSLQGFDFAKLQAGLDYRVERRAAIGPIVGLDLCRFVWESAPRSDGFQTTSHPRVNTFVFVGVMGRLDFAKDTHGKVRVASM